MKNQVSISEGLSVWAMPSPTSARFLQPQIELLAQRYRGPVFQAHLTVHSVKFEGPQVRETFLRLLPEALHGAGTFELPVRELVVTDEYYRNVIIKLDDPSGILRLLEKRLSAITNFAYSLDPHLSLFYGGLTQHEKSTLESILQIPESITFHSTALVHTPANCSSNEERVKSWRVLWESEDK